MNPVEEKEYVHCDLRKENKEFCTMWGCKCFNRDYSCTSCPVLSDLESMANAFSIRFQFVESLIGSKAA